MRIIILFNLLLSTLLFAQKNDTSTVIILHTNDMHGYINNYPKMKYVVDSISNVYKNVMLVSSGDLFSGNPFVDKYKDPGYPMIDLMNKMDYMVTAVGNHEFDYGQETLKKRIQQANFKFLCANINTKESVLNEMIYPYTKINLGGISFIFISALKLTDQNIPATLPKNLNNLTFNDPIKTLQNYSYLKDSADFIIGNTHLGYKTDSVLATKTNYINVILGGHSHTEIDTPKVINKTLVCQAKSYNKFLGVLTLKFVGKKLVYINDKLISIKSEKKENNSIKKLVDKYYNNPLFYKQIAHLPKTLTGVNEIGQLIVNAFLNVSENKIDIAFMNYGGIRIDTLPDNVKYIDVFKLDPFNNDLMTAKLNLNELKSFLLYSFSKKHKKILTGNIKFDFVVDKSGNAVDVKLFDKNGKPLKQKEYNVLLNSYMASAFKFKGKEKFKNIGVKSNDAIISYLINNYKF